MLIQVAYAGCGGTDIAQRRGKFNPRSDAPFNHRIMGLEVSGLVSAVGEGVEGLEKGARVCALVYGGGYAQWTVAPLEQVLRLPANMPLEVGAAVPENFWTVWANVFDARFGNLAENPAEKTFLVHGGAGGIGSTAITLAHRMGAKVITTVSSAAKAAACTRWGADVCIDYTKIDFVAAVMKATGGKGADVILCFCGGDYVARNVDALAKYGRLVQIGLRRGKDIEFDIKVLMTKWAMMTGGHLRPRTIEDKGRLRDALAEHVAPLWADGSLPMPTIHTVLPLAEAGKAHQMLEASEVIGKIVLQCSQAKL